MPKNTHWIRVMGGRIPAQVIRAIDECGSGALSTREIAQEVSRKTGYNVTQSAVARRQRQRRAASAELARAIAMATPVVRIPEPPRDQHITASDQARASDRCHCWECGCPEVPGIGLAWGRCGRHCGDRWWTFLAYAAGFGIPEGWAPVPEAGLGPGEAA